MNYIFKVILVGISLTSSFASSKNKNTGIFKNLGFKNKKIFEKSKKCPKGTRLVEGEHIKSQCAPFGLPVQDIYPVESIKPKEPNH